MSGADAGAIRLPENHPLRIELNDEVHARPPEALLTPCRMSYLAMYSDWPFRDEDRRTVYALAERFGVQPPENSANHYSADLGPFRIKWERHTEFTRYLFIVAGEVDDPFGASAALQHVPSDWIAELPGKVIAAAHAALLPAPRKTLDFDAIAQRHFAGNMLIGAGVGGASATAVTDFRIRPDGFNRFLVYDTSLTPRQAGRTFQRLFEIETYRVLALLAFPVARSLGPFLLESERELARIATSMTSSGEQDDPQLLERLSKLEAAIASRHADNDYRFSAAQAYHALVGRRIEELRESRLPGMQTFKEFTERRLVPAMDTCRSTSARQASLSERVAQTTQLLSTRVEVSAGRQNQALLESMDRRARLQLRLQETVEGLSIAAVTYYIVGLVKYAAEGVAALGIDVNVYLVTGLSIPLVAGLVALGVRRIRRAVASSNS
ncbi:MAG: DUF3422 domain-containing protein [Gammaproteobacteria bacterium]|nr:DUF3422 domain-containing protein [Gammaproteobacteria bacterium]NNM00126.1 DUF3422 domain-containing protein [Gammaproteobacteria bacterium]